jgi:protoporphyrin/coproporphyrin ferrochelatase
METETAVLVSCHGTVARVDDLAAFVQNIRHGRPAPDEVVAEVRRRFEHIGGSPLMHITEEQAAALALRLGVPVRACARLWHPYPAEILAELAAAGVRRVVSLPLAPQSVHVYHDAVEHAAAPLGVAVVKAPSYGPALVAPFVRAIAEVWPRFQAPPGSATPPRTAVVLSAHSLPMAVIERGDPYERQFREVTDAVGARLPAALPGLDPSLVRVAFQSQGMGGGAWLGPDLDTTFRHLRSAGADGLLVAPIGFLAEHVETLYDIDVDAAALARELGFTRLERMPPMNTRADFIDVLADVARPLLAGAT